MNEAGYIYAIRHRESGRAYIGSTCNVEKRLYEHRRLLRQGKHHSPLLQNCWNKYGEDSFEFLILETVEDRIFLLAREQFTLWRNADRSLNCASACGTPKGVKRSAETRAKLSAITKARGNPEKAWAGNRGRVMSAEERAKRSDMQKRVTAEGRRKPRDWSAEARARHGEALRGRKMPPVSDQTRINISKALKGRVVTDQHKQRLTEANERWLADRRPVWLAMREQGMSYRKIGIATGNCKEVIARELKKIEGARI